MTLWIIATGLTPPVTVKLEGRLTGEEVPELRRVCEEVRGRVVVDLCGLQSADRQGVSALQALREQGARLTGASPYVEHLLGGGPPQR